MRERGKESGKSEGPPGMGGIVLAISPHAKASRLAHGLLGRENLAKRQRQGKQMTEEPQEGLTGAPFHRVTDWHAIDWESANHTVRRLQARIVARP